MIPENILNEVISEIADKKVISLIPIIKGKVHVSEFKIAEKLNISINEVRNMLYKLSEYNIVDSIRKKDKKKGWYVYYWVLDPLRVRELAVKLKRERIAMLRERISKEEKTDFLICPDKHIRLSMENAMEYDFRCPECDVNLQRDDNKKVITSLNNQIIRLEEEIKLLESLEILPLGEKKAREEKKKIVKKQVKKKIKEKKGIKKKVLKKVKIIKKKIIKKAKKRK